MRLPPFEVKPEDARYTEVTEELKHSLRVGDFRTGELLTQVLEQEIYGHWDSFAAYTKGELRISPQHAYRQIAAWNISVRLKTRSLQLPLNERQIRALNQLTSEDDQALAWERSCQQKQHGQPTYADVQREVHRLRKGPISPETDKTYRIYKKHLERVRTDLRRASEILASGDLEPFLHSTEKPNLRRQQRLLQLVHNIGIELGDHYRKLLGQVEVTFEEQD